MAESDKNLGAALKAAGWPNKGQRRADGRARSSRSPPSSSGTSRGIRRCRARGSVRRGFRLIAAGLGICGCFSSTRACARARRGSRCPIDVLAAAALGVAAVVAGLLFYILAADKLGFTSPVLHFSRFGSVRSAGHGALRAWSPSSPPWRFISRSTRCCAFRCPGDCWSRMLFEALRLVFDPYVLWVILASAAFGLFVGAVPGLTATMATALSCRSLFHGTGTRNRFHRHRNGDGDLRRRHPELPAAHAGDAGVRRLHRRGLCHDARPGRARARRGARVLGDRGLFGTAVLIMAAPALAEIALKFSSFEYFWLVVLGLFCAVFIAFSNPLKGSCRCCSGCSSRRSGSTTRRVSALHLRQRRARRRAHADPDHDRHVRGVRRSCGMSRASTSRGRWRRRRSATCSAACGV